MKRAKHPTSRRRTRLGCSAIAFAAMAASLPARAIDVTWLGGTGSWSENRWSTGAYPATGLYRAVIDSLGAGTSNVGLRDMDVSVAGLRIGVRDQLGIAFGRQLTLFGDVDVAGIPDVAGAQGTLYLTSGGRLSLAAPVTFSGAGQTVLADSDNNVIVSSAGNTMTIAPGHTVSGGGRLGSNAVGYLSGGLVNQGLIVASGQMGIDTGGADFRNAGLVRVTGSLSVNAITNNTGGVFELADGRSLNVGGTLSGGTVRSLGSSYISGGTFSGVTLQGNLQVAGADLLTLGGNTQITGILAIGGFASGAGSSFARLQIAGPTTLAGSGQTVLSAGYNNVVTSDSTSPLTIASGHTLRGSGYLGASFIGYLQGGLVNQGLIAAETARGIQVDTGSGDFDNRSGRITVADGSVIALADSVTLRGGTLTGTGSARLQGGTFADLALAGSFQLAGGTSATFMGTITNSGTLTLNTNGTSGSRLRVGSGGLTLAGSGRTVLPDDARNVIYSDGGNTLTIAAGHTVTGGGRLGTSAVAYLQGGLVNQGLIVTDAGTGMVIDTGGTDFRNASTVRVTRGELTVNAVTDNSGGLFDVQAAGRLKVGGALSGGTVRGAAGSLIYGGRISNATLEGSLSIPVAQTLILGGSIVNNGVLALGDAVSTGSSIAALRINGATTLAGSGQTVLVAAGSGPRVIYSDNDSPLTIATGHTVRGSGYLGTSFLGYLQGGMVNNGLIVAEGSGGLSVNTGGAGFDNRGGRITVADASVFSLAEGTSVLGGSITGSGSARIEGAFRDVALQGALQVTRQGAVNLAGTVVNTGTFTLSDGGASFVHLRVGSGGLTLAGSGSTVIANNVNTVVTSGAGDLLTIAAGHTLRGGGSLGSSSFAYLQGGLLNQGTLVADSGMNIDTGGAAVINRGTLRVDAGGFLTVRNVALTQDAAAGLIDVRGTLVAPLGVAASAGRVQGTGRIQGNVDASGATVAPGASVGRLSLTGALTLGDTSHLAIEAAGLVRGTGYDWLDVSGGVLLDGTLDVDIGYTAAIGDSFSFLTAGAVTGRFDAVTSPGYVLAIDYGSSVVTATVVGISAVPEPQTWLMLLAGAGGLLARKAAARRAHAPRPTA